MSKLITIHKGFSISLLPKSELLELSKFVVKENFTRHKNNDDSYNYDDINKVYQEESILFSQSMIFVAKNINNEIIGSIRLLSWNGKYELPISKIFGIYDLESISPENSKEHIWHIGRFAISGNLGKRAVILFKALLMCAILPIYKNKKGIMFAECDEKLFNTVNLMGIKAISLSDGIEYLGSTTFPMYTIRDGFNEFISKNSELVNTVNNIYSNLIYNEANK